MTNCAHPDLHTEEGTQYCCATCGQRFVVMRIDEPQVVVARSGHKHAGLARQAPAAGENALVAFPIVGRVLTMN